MLLLSGCGLWSTQAACVAGRNAKWMTLDEGADFAACGRVWDFFSYIGTVWTPFGVGRSGAFYWGGGPRASGAQYAGRAAENHATALSGGGRVMGQEAGCTGLRGLGGRMRRVFDRLAGSGAGMGGRGGAGIAGRGRGCGRAAQQAGRLGEAAIRRPSRLLQQVVQLQGMARRRSPGDGQQDGWRQRARRGSKGPRLGRVGAGGAGAGLAAGAAGGRGSQRRGRT